KVGGGSFQIAPIAGLEPHRSSFSAKRSNHNVEQQGCDETSSKEFMYQEPGSPAQDGRFKQCNSASCQPSDKQQVGPMEKLSAEFVLANSNLGCELRSRIPTQR